MGLLYNLVDKGVTKDEIELCLKRIKDLWSKLSDEFDLDFPDFKGIIITYCEDNIITLEVRFDSRRVKLQYNYSIGACTAVGKESQETIDDIGDVDIDTSKVRGYFFNIMKTINNLPHKLCKIVIKVSDKETVEIYETRKEFTYGVRGSIIMITGTSESIFNNFKNHAKIVSRNDLAELSFEKAKERTEL